MENKQNIFVIGLDEINLEQLQSVRGAEGYAFHNLIPYDEIVNPDSYPMEQLMETAERELRTFPGTVDAIIGHWDFPTTSMLPILRREIGLPGPSLESVLVCENKYWARVRAAEAVPECNPDFQGIDPFADDPVATLRLDYPFWIKPVTAFSSYLGFRIENEAQLRDALAEIRENITKFAEPFDYIMRYVERPELLPDGHGGFCVAESLISGELCTLEGYIFNGEVVVYAVLDSIRGPNQVSFERYQYPSHLPPTVQARMTDAAARVLQHIGLDNTPFNMELFWNPETDRIWLLEINPRISKSHCPIFRLVAGASHHEVAIDVALGRYPQFPRADGGFAVAAKFMPRTYADTVVTRVPGERELEELQRLHPEAILHIYVEEGMALSDLPNQDSYSFEFADLFLGAQSEEELMLKFRNVMALLDFRFSEPVPTNYD